MTEEQWHKLEHWMATQTSELRTLKRHVIGESNPERSLMYRVGSLEEQNRRHTWWIRTMGTGLIGSIAAWIVSHLTGKHL